MARALLAPIDHHPVLPCDVPRMNNKASVASFFGIGQESRDSLIGGQLLRSVKRRQSLVTDGQDNGNRHTHQVIEGKR